MWNDREEMQALNKAALFISQLNHSSAHERERLLSRFNFLHYDIKM